MIDAHEIKIGNIFIRELKTSRGLEYDHHFIVTEEEMGKLFGNNIGLALQDLFPIPLTTDILLATEFVRGDYHKNWFSHYELTPHIVKYDDGFILEMVDDIRVSESFNSLHQLQNLYYCLCGKELDIKL